MKSIKIVGVFAVVALLVPISAMCIINHSDSYDRVVVFCIDGAGICATDTPNLDRIFDDGFWSESVTAEMPSKSSQNWGSALTGVSPNYHGLNNDIVEANVVIFNYPTYFGIMDKHTDRPLASIANWSYNNMIEDSEGICKKNCITCEEVVAETISYMSSNDPKLLSVYMDSPDLAGHEYGFDSPEYYMEIRKIDAYVGEIYDKMLELDWVKDSLIIAMTDHGGIDKRHGGSNPKETTTFLGVAGHSVVGNDIPGIRVRDIAAIVLYGLRCNINAEMTARLPIGMFI